MHRPSLNRLALATTRHHCPRQMVGQILGRPILVHLSTAPWGCWMLFDTPLSTCTRCSYAPDCTRVQLHLHSWEWIDGSIQYSPERSKYLICQKVLAFTQIKVRSCLPLHTEKFVWTVILQLSTNIISMKIKSRQVCTPLSFANSLLLFWVDDLPFKQLAKFFSATRESFIETISFLQMKLMSPNWFACFGASGMGYEDLAEELLVAVLLGVPSPQHLRCTLTGGLVGGGIAMSLDNWVWTMSRHLFWVS